MLKNLNVYQIVLASKSPRRQELLKEMGVNFTVMTKSVDESYPANLPLSEVAPYLSLKKAKAFDANELPDNYMIITADTVVIADNHILGKPKNNDDAKKMLNILSGQIHKVVTGVTVKTKNCAKTFSVTSRVTFEFLDNDEITYYIENCNPFDKAGAYGIQEWIGYIGVSNVEGSFYNVMGLPTQRLYRVLKEF